MTATATVAPPGRREKNLALAVVCSALFLALLDSTVISLALPTIQRDLGTDVGGLQWIVDGYILLYAALLLTGGTLGDRYGRRQVFLAGMALFTAGSLLCALSGSVAALTAGRAVQGVGAAAITPQTLAILAQVFPEQRERARAFGIWSAVSGLALLLGPVAGGTFAELLGWQSVFLLNLPIGLVALYLGRRLPVSTAARAPRPLDLPGQLLTLCWLAPLTYGLVEGARTEWSDPVVISALTVGGGAFVALLTVERRREHPMLRLDFFRSRTFTGSTSVTFLIAFALNAGFLLLSLLLQLVAGADPAEAGVRLLPTMAAIVLAAALAGPLSGRLGPRLPIILGTALAATATLLMGGFAVGEPYARWWPLLCLLGLGVGMVMSPNNTVLVGSAPPGATAQAAALGGAAQQVGALLGVASLGLVLQHTTPMADLAREASALSSGLEHGLLLAGSCYATAAVLAALLIKPAARTPG